MRKCFNKLIILILMILFVSNVYAEEIDKNDDLIEVVSIMQGEKELVQDENGIYQVDGIEEIYLKYKFKNIDNIIKNDKYYSIGGGIRAHIYTNGKRLLERTFETQIYLSAFDEMTDFNISLYDSEYEEIDIKTIKFKFNLHDEYSSKYRELLYGYNHLYSLRQGGVELKLDENGVYNVNNVEDIDVYLYKNKLLGDLNYKLYINNDEYDLKLIGENEVLIKSLSIDEIKRYYNYINVGISSSVYDGISNSYRVSYYDDENIENFDFELGYTNYLDKEIESSQVSFNEESKYYVISPKYHNKNDTIMLLVKGNKYLDKDYDIDVEIVKDNKVLYTKNDKVNGLLLNDGYNIELDGFVSKLAIKYEELSLYDVKVKIGNKTSMISYKYSQGKGDIAVGASLFYEDGKLNLYSFAGAGEYFYTARQYESNKEAFNKFTNMYISFLGQNFDLDEIYDYELSYVSGWNDTYYDYDKDHQVVKKGKVSGLVLNTVGLVVAINNRNDYEYPEYRLTVKKDDEIIHYSMVTMRITDSELIANIGLVANNKSLYLRTMGDVRHIQNSYIATRNYPLTMAITGVGFDDDKEYSLNYIVYGDYDSDSVEFGEVILEERELKFTGKELNTGNAKIIFDKDVSEDIEKVSFVIMGAGGQGAFYVEYVDVLELFNKVTSYIVDNTQDLIKNIKKKTSVEELNNNLDIVDNGSVKIFDKTGVNEVDGNVGTGMIARVVDEYERSLLDMDVVVKGDITGDGNISITDLIKVRQHLANIEKLDGVYEMAGDTTDTGKISITDLIKIRQDLAKIAELD